MALAMVSVQNRLLQLMQALTSLPVIWKRQFTFVYGRLYENNGRRTSIRVLRYSLDALACK